MPELYILAGPNGAGKTTYYFTAIEQGFIDADLPFVNVDLITNELGEYTEENFTAADTIARNRIAKYIEGKESFMIESNLAKTSDYEWIERVAKRGYQTILYFLGTDDIDINKNRVKKRVKEGGHDVPENIIEHRYSLGISYLKSKILFFNEAYLIDNSQEIPRKIAFLQNGEIVEKNNDCPPWANEVLFIAEQLQGKRRRSS